MNNTQTRSLLTQQQAWVVNAQRLYPITQKDGLYIASDCGAELFADLNREVVEQALYEYICELGLSDADLRIAL